jgi:hypothetical protein
MITAARIEQKAREVRKLLPSRDFTQPGSRPMPLDEAVNKITNEYSDALDLLGRI